MGFVIPLLLLLIVIAVVAIVLMRKSRTGRVLIAQQVPAERPPDEQ